MGKKLKVFHFFVLLAFFVFPPSFRCAPANKQSYNFRVSTLDLEDPYEDKIAALDSGKVLTLPSSDFGLSVLGGFMDYPSFKAATHLLPQYRPVDLLTPKYLIEENVTMLDHRFANPDHYNDMRIRRKVLVSLLKGWTDFCNEHGLTTWMAHGTLLGWFWGQKIFPWDKDLDFQVSMKDMFKLWLLNGTVYQNKFLIDVNPNSIFRKWEKDNVIDARIIDRRNGMYLDITALAFVHSDTFVSCKSPHNYTLDDLFPLHSTVYEGITVWRPDAFVKMMTKEYSWKCLTRTSFSVEGISYHWDQILNSFVKDKRQRIRKKPAPKKS